MGLIKAITGAAGGVLADQWKEYFICDAMEEVYNGHGVYIGAANGELTESLSIKRIRQLEESW